MVLDVSNPPSLQAKTGRAAHGRHGRSMTTPAPLVAAEGCVLRSYAQTDARKVEHERSAEPGCCSNGGRDPLHDLDVDALTAGCRQFHDEPRHTVDPRITC